MHLLKKRFGRSLTDINLWTEFINWIEFDLKQNRQTYLRFSLAKVKELLRSAIPEQARIPADELPERPQGKRAKRADDADPRKIWELKVVRLCGEGGALKSWKNNEARLKRIGIKSMADWKPIHDRRRKEAFGKSRKAKSDANPKMD